MHLRLLVTSSEVDATYLSKQNAGAFLLVKFDVREPCATEQVGRTSNGAEFGAADHPALSLRVTTHTTKLCRLPYS